MAGIFSVIREKGTRFQDIPKLLPSYSPKNEDTLHQCKSEILRKLSATDWDTQRAENIGAEVQAILEMAKTYGEILIDDAVVTALFQTNNFILPIGDLTLGLLNYLITLPPEMIEVHGMGRGGRGGMDMDMDMNMVTEGFEPKPRSFSSTLQRAVSVWINRLYNLHRDPQGAEGGKKKRKGLLSGLTRGIFSGGSAGSVDGPGGIAEISLTQLLENLLRWWSENCVRLQGEKSTFGMEAEWVIGCHFASIFLTSPSVCREFLKEIGLVAKHTKLPPMVQRAYVSSLREASRQVPGDETFRLMYPDTKLMAYKQQKSFSVWQRSVHRELVEQLLKNSDIFHDAKKRRKTLLGLLQKDGALWPLFAFWFVEQQKTVDGMEKLNEGQMAIWNVISKVFAEVKNIFEEAYTSMIEYSANIALIKICVGVASPVLMKDCWTAVGMPPAVTTCTELSTEITEQLEVLQKIKIVVDTFYVGSETQTTVHAVLNQWDTLQIRELRCFFRTYDVTEYSLPKVRFPTLDVDFLNAWKWLYSLVPCELFKLIWSEQKGSNDLHKLIPGSIAFKEEYDDLLSSRTTFARMRKIAPILNSRDERKYFCNAAPGYSQTKGISSWTLIGSKKKVKSDIRVLMSDWLHLFSVYQTINNIIRVLDCLHLFIKSSGIPSLDAVKNAAASLFTVFQREVFDDKTVEEQPRFIPDSSKIHECFVILNPDLFETIVKCMAVLDWLRELPDDTDFTNGIEEAMGKSEMECPVELWQEQEGKPGRVDEQKLSMLSTVRGYLHDLIYRSNDRLDDLNSLINILKELRTTDENIINSLITANQYRISLRELLDDKSENGAPDRLIQLLLPIRKAKWLCTSTSDDKDSNTGQVWLRWEVPRGGIISEKKQNLNELMDFQSSIVLAKTDQQGPDVMEAVDNFIHAFGWIRQLQENLTNLLQSGHFDFQKFDVSFSLSEDPNVIRDEAVRCSEILSNWAKQVETQRNTSYFLNFYSMRHVWKLVSTIRSISIDEIDDLDQENSKYVTMKDILCLLNPDNASADTLTVNEFIRNFHTFWIETESNPSKPLEALDALELCGKCLEYTLKDFESRHRPVDIPEISMYPAGADIEKGLNILCANNSEHVFDHILSTYARAGYLPERELVYVCRSTTTWDEVYTLLLRWARSHLHDRVGKFFCLAGIENISFELQRKAANIIRENIGSAENPLLVISGNDDKQHLVAQFAHCRTSVISLPEDVIQKFSNEISTKYSQGIAAHTSQYAGAGKTFNIRRNAASSLSSYVPVAVMRADNVLSHINKNIKKRNLNCEMDYITLHLDIYDTAQDSLSPLLFDLIFLGGIEDNIAGVQFFWNPELATIAVEVPTGQLVEKVRVCGLIPQCEAVVSGTTFCNTNKGLREGMGDEDFMTARNDGTAIACNSSSPDELNAYTRLQYVCTGLDIMKNNQGRFPFVFEKPNVSLLESLKESQNQQFITKSSSFVLSPERCFELLMGALDLEKPSLWCIWNFINVFYWQLRDMHAPDSPINCACMPDPNAERKGDIETKAKFKGEVVQFLIRTAREFATRQVKEVETNSIQGVFVTGMSRQEFNGFWEKMECENDGKPAFQKRSAFGSKNFIYYRKEENAWVIDDLIDPTGPVYSRCEKGLDMDALWSTTPEWCENTKIKVEKITDKKGYNGEAVRVSGCLDDGGSVSDKENGIYLRQPEYDNINGQPHYILTRKDIRRHIFIGSDHGWQICPICTDEEGTFCMSSSKNVTGRWRAMPPDKKEERSRFLCLTEDQIEEYKKKPAASFARSEPRDRAAEKAAKLALKDSLRISSTGEVGNEEEEDEEEETMEQLWDNTLKWNDSNHECVLFSNQTHVVSFLSLDPERLRNRMHPGLLTHLKRNHINVGEDLNILSNRFHEILSALTEVNKTAAEAKKILDGKYCLTGDSLLKMLAIFARLRCGVPVVLMGECGCGKTMLINYICAWMNVKLLILDVHGGTNEEDILGIFDKAEKELQKGEQKIFVLLDEINTCAHMGLMTEVICHRSLYSKRLDDRIHVLAALNPYRRRPDSGGVPGLVFQIQGGGNAPPDPMSQLVYRVHPIPKTLRDFIFDFGALTPTNEKTYILSMVKDKIPNESQFIVEHIANLIHYSQQFIRTTEKDDSSASLRDVRRCLRLIGWFQEIVVYRGKQEKMISALACSTTLALAFVYFFRLSSSTDRDAYWKRLGISNKDISWRAKEMDTSGFLMLREEGAFERVIKTFQNFIGRQMVVEDGIAMNDALMENLFVVIICILTRIPIFVVGKPGSSKTLTMQVISSNLQGKQSPIEFWRRYPAVYIFPYQCSPMSDSHSIQHQFDMAVRYQEHAENTITVLLLDEVGLAEHSPEMPLKVLHGMLVDPPISVVGLSNWVLDPAKMNRAILLQRTEPSQDDIQLTGKSIVSSGSKQSPLDKYLSPLAKAYHKIYTNQKGRDFVGMRDYYNLVKLLRIELSKQRGNSLSADILTNALCRNFGGKRDLLRDVLVTFHTNCFGNTDKLVNPSVAALINENLEDPTARHLMLLTKNSAALPLMFGCNLLNERTTKVLVGSEFKDDRTELHLITQINEVKLAMAEGSRLVLLNHDNIYEALYDVLNQRYLYKKDQNGNVKKMLRLAIGSRSQLCNVADGFKIVVIVEQDHAYRNLDLPLLNRFEKQVLCGEDVLGPRQRKVVDQVTEWTENILDTTGLSSMQEVFCGFHAGTIPSAVLNICKFNEENIDETTVDILKSWLLNVARPIAVMNSTELKALAKNYFEEHSCLKGILEKHVFSVGGFGASTITLTHSPISHLDDAVATSGLPCGHVTLQLGELTSERQLYSHLRKFFTTDIKSDQLLIIQCDPISCRQSLINHARYVCVKERSQYEYDNRNETAILKRHVLFLVHLPPGTKQRNRHFALDFISPWTYIFVDDLRSEEVGTGKANTVTLLTTSVFDLVKAGSISLSKIYLTKFQHALSSCSIPDVNNPAAYFGARVETVRRLLNEVPLFSKFIETTIMAILETYSGNVRISDKEDAIQVPIHVRMVCNDLVGGSLRQSLDIAIETLIVQAFSHVLCELDCNFNLSTVWTKGKEEESFKLWLSLLQNSAITDSIVIARKSKVGGEAFVRSLPVRNTGIFEPLVTQFPFSYRLIPILNERSTRDQVEGIGGDPHDTLTALCPNLFGEEIVSNWIAFGKEEHVEYLNDFVATAMIPVPGAKFSTTRELCEKLFRITRPDSLRSPAGIHVAAWENETRLFRCSSLLANNRIHDSSRKGIISSIQSIPVPSMGCSVAPEAIKDRLAEVDFCVLSNFLANNWNRIRDRELYATTKALTNWINEFSSVRSELELYLLSLVNYEGRKMYKDIDLVQLRASFLGLRVIHIYFQETMTELMYQQQTIVQPLKFIKLAQEVQLTNMEFLQKLILAYYDHLEADYRYLGVSFIRRYLQEVVFGEQEGFYNIGSKHTFSTEFLEALESIYANNIHKKEFLVLVKDLALRRALLHCLVQANYQLKLSGTEALQLYLQYEFDKLSEIKGWKQNNLFTDEDSNTCLQLASKTKDKKSLLEAIAKAQSCIHEYGDLLVRKDAEEKMSSFLFPVLEKMLTVDEGHVARVLVMKVIKGLGGIDALGQIVHDREEIKWMRINRGMSANTDISLPDPFVWIHRKEIYEQLCGAVRSCATQSTKQTVQLEKISEKDLRHDLLIATLFSQVALETDSLFDKGVDALRRWVSSKITLRSEVKLSNWVLDRCPKFNSFIDTKALSGLCQLQVGVNLAIWAVSKPDTWLHSLFFDVNAHKDSFLVSVPNDEFASVVKASGRVGWYLCPNGHKYSVGQCTMPMQKARCPSCNATIGGSNHVSVQGVRRLDDSEIKGDPDHGYSIENNESECIRLPTLSGRFMRFVLHVGLLFSCCIDPSISKKLAELVCNKTKVDPVEFLSKRLKYDWKRMRHLSSLGDGDLTLVLHMAIREFREGTSLAKGVTIRDTATRDREETKLSGIINRLFSDSQLRAKIQHSREQLEDANSTSAIRLTTGEKLWYEIHEEQFSGNENPDLHSLLWRYREPVSFDSFQQFWGRQLANVKERYSLLRTLLKEEERLPSIRGVCDILAWHSILFEVIPHMSLTRTDAIDMTNNDIIEKLPKERQEEARQIFTRFCSIFNLILPTIDPLYECTENPFIKNGRVDLGDGAIMDENTPVGFSLPSTVTGEDQGNYIHGMCTIRILQILVDSQNEILVAIEEGGTKKGGFKRFPGGNPATPAAPEPVVAQQPLEIPNVPAVSYKTPTSILENQLVIYNREKDFLPLLRMFAEQTLQYKYGGDLSYNVGMIESALANGLLAGKRQINLCISHYQYRGDVQVMGQLSLLESKLPQERVLASNIKEGIMGEIDTQNKTVKLLQILEVCIQFIVSIGSSTARAFDGRTTLSSCVSNLHISREEWDSVSTPTIRQQICLRNIQALYLLLESMLNGNPLDDVPSAYCDNITEAQEFALRTASSKMDMSVLVPALHDFIIGQLITSSYGPEYDMKDFLGYGDLGEEDWWDNEFPEVGLQLAHAKAVYEVLERCA